MPESEQLLKSILQELKNVLAEPYASGQAKILFIENLINRFPESSQGRNNLIVIIFIKTARNQSIVYDLFGR